MEKEEIKELLNRYYTGNCSEEEKAIVETVYNKVSERATAYPSEDTIKKDLQAIYKTLPQPQRSTIKILWPQLAAAVIVLVVLSIGLNFYFEKSSLTQKQSVGTAISKKDNFVSASNKAYLTLADGSNIILDNAENGEIAKQSGIKITKNANGLIVYSNEPSPTDVFKSNAYNTITTPKGGQYQIVLSDGTKVWLNAASSLKYPISFSGEERRVELKGEGYFEVAKNVALPFKILTEGQEVEVLGTHFNINSYDNEPATKTTLLEGSVKITPLNTKKSILLKPGEQAELKNNESIKVTNVKAVNAIAWKRGLFQFQDSDIENVMRQLARWYDVDVEFEGKIPNITLWGEVHRDTSLVQTLEALSYFDLKYRIVTKGESKKIIITQ